MAAPPEADSSEYSREFFYSKQVPWLKEFLKARGIQTSGKRKAELLDLCWKSHEIKVLKVDEIEEPESVESIVKSKLTTEDDGLLVNPLQVNVGWTNRFSEIPSFGFPDIYNYLVGECAYTQESLKSYKSLLGFKLYYDGHVENLQLLNSPLKKQSNYHQFRFSVRPTERSKLDGGETTYRGFFILKKDGSVYSGYCQCKGGADGGCRHLAAALFDLLATVLNAEMEACTSKVCVWVRKGKRNEGCLPIFELDVGRPEYGKKMKSTPSVTDFNPLTTSYDVTELRIKFNRELGDSCRNAVVLPFLPSFPQNTSSEDALAKYITDSNNVAKEEIVKSVCVYSLQEHADLFAAEKGISESDEVPIQLAEEFISSLNISDEQIQIINEQTLGQSESQFWFAQRAGRVTASSFYTVCHLRDTTDRRNTVKNLMIYCPLNSDSAPEQLVWGHEKETVAINQYLKKTSKKHKSVTVDRSGLIVAKSMPFLGASPDGIRKCGCCPQKTIVEAKSLYSKRNLLPAVAAAAFLEEDDEGNLKLKSETKWNYQIQGLMGISGIHDADLVIYTNKGILIIPVPFDESLWNQMKSKLRAFYVNYMVEELITKKIFKSLCK